MTALTRALIREAQRRLGLSDAALAARYGLAAQSWRRYKTRADASTHREPSSAVLAQVLADAGMVDG